MGKKVGRNPSVAPHKQPRKHPRELQGLGPILPYGPTHRGPTVTLGKHLTKAVPYFIAGIKFNMAGTNASGKVQRDQNICASITLLTVLAQNIVGLDYAKHVGAHFDAERFANHLARRRDGGDWRAVTAALESESEGNPAPPSVERTAAPSGWSRRFSD